MVDLNLSLKRTDTKPGDMLLRLDTGGVIGGTISALTKSNLVHGGLAVGENKVIEVNGDLPADSSGKSRLLANIYRSDLTVELKDSEYIVFRCKDADLSAQVAREAYLFLKKGVEQGWGYDVSGAVAALFHNPKTPESQGLLLQGRTMPNYGTFATASRDGLNHLLTSKTKFFCTQWMVVMYLETAKSFLKSVVIGVEPDQALPGVLAAALEKSKDFEYKGVIRK